MTWYQQSHFQKHDFRVSGLNEFWFTFPSLFVLSFLLQQIGQMPQTIERQIAVFMQSEVRSH